MYSGHLHVVFSMVLLLLFYPFPLYIYSTERFSYFPSTCFVKVIYAVQKSPLPVSLCLRLCYCNQPQETQHQQLTFTSQEICPFISFLYLCLLHCILATPTSSLGLPIVYLFLNN